MNRANAGLTIFEKDADDEAFENVLIEAVARTQTRLLADCVMRHHWHLVVWPREDRKLSQFVGWLTLTHTQRWHADRQLTGSGHVDQGRFKSFPIQDDDHLFRMARYAARYAERHAQRAHLVRRAEQWRWGRLYRWLRGSAEDRRQFAAWSMPRPANGVAHVKAPQTAAELAALRRCVQRGSPYGTEMWCDRTIGSLGMESTIRPRGRPKKQNTGYCHLLLSGERWQQVSLCNSRQVHRWQPSGHRNRVQRNHAGSRLMQDDHSTNKSNSRRFAELGRGAWNQCLLLVWASWWGGLCFYAVVVVPIGTEVIGSVEQGFITQRVTQWHNGLSCIFILCLLIEAYRRSSRVLWAGGAVLAIIEIALVAWHLHLTSMMDFQHQSVPKGFYSAHALYLWLTAIEWIVGLTMPAWIFAITPVQVRRQAELR